MRPQKALRIIAEGRGLAGELRPAGGVSLVIDFDAGVQHPVGNGDLLPGSSYDRVVSSGRRAQGVAAVKGCLDAERVVAPHGAAGG